MRQVSTWALIALLAATGGASAQQADTAKASRVVRAGSLAPAAGPAANFIGTVGVVQLVAPQPPARTAMGLVTFQPGARGSWHTHPAGQILYVTDGCGWTHQEGGPVERICAGDTVTVGAGIKHWHGATATEAMSHLAVTETIEGKNVEWLEPVTDAEFVGPSGN